MSEINSNDRRSSLRVRSKLKTKSGIDLAAMVDIVFLLVTYFLLNATLVKNPAIKIELPKSTEAKSKVQKTLVIYVAKGGNYFLNEVPIQLRDIPVELAKRATDKDKDNIIIKGDKGADYQSIIDVMDYVRKAGITKFNLATKQ